MLKFLDNKKDRIIALMITFFILYCMVSRYNVRVMELMLKVSPFQLTYNELPEGYGALIITILGLSMISTIIYLIKNKSIAKALKILIVGIGVSIVLFIGYQLHCQLILNIPSQVKANEINIWLGDRGETITLKEDSVYWEEVQELALNMNPLSNKEQHKLVEMNRELDLLETYKVFIRYPKKYGTNFEVRLNMGEDVIYIQNGHGYKERTYCYDNGIRELLHKIIATELNNAK